MITIGTIATVNIRCKSEEGVDEAIWQKTQPLKTMLETARENRLNVITTALTLEEQLGSIILKYFLGESRKRETEFEELILHSEWCTFASKRKLVAHIVREQKLIQGTEQNAFERLLRDAMSFRNAFTHGQMYADG